MSNEKDSYSPRYQPTWLEQARHISASTGWEKHVCPAVCPSVRFCSTRHGTAGGKCSNKSVLIGVVDIPWCMTGRCFSNWLPASEEDFGRVPTWCLLVIFRRRFCYSSEQVHKIISVRCIAVLHFHTFSVFPLQCLKCVRIPWQSFCSVMQHGHLVCRNTIMWKCVMTKWQENFVFALQRGVKREE